MTKFNEHDILFEEDEVSLFLEHAKSEHQKRELSSQDLLKAQRKFHELQKKRLMTD